VAHAEQVSQDEAGYGAGEIMMVESESGPLNCRLQRYIVEEVI